MSPSNVVTGGGRGVGRALVERLLGDEDTVVAKLELETRESDESSQRAAGSCPSRLTLPSRADLHPRPDARRCSRTRPSRRLALAFTAALRFVHNLA
jgi:NAD(P)-dependent dehydrogenase (short-subunit alcohol dehydrogenase family)